MSKRIGSLDSLRGIASLLVVFSHCIHMQLVTSPSGAAVARMGELMGKDSVLVFFVLSGFVLFLSFRKGEPIHYLGYIMKRVARIWLPFAAAILISALLFALIGHQQIPELSYWFNGNWRIPLSPELILGHLAMTDWTEWQSLNVVMWSLVYEMRISLIFPVVALAIRRNWLAALGVSLVISIISLAFHKHFSGPITPFSALRYLWLFAVGAAMALNGDKIRIWFGARPLWQRMACWLPVLALLAIPFEAVENISTPLASIGIVFLCFADAPTDRLLAKPLPEWLGRISYSLYLIHLPILVALTHLLFGIVPMPVLILLIVVTSLAAAQAMNLLVERPAIKLGRALAARQSGSRPMEDDAAGKRNAPPRPHAHR